MTEFESYTSSPNAELFLSESMDPSGQYMPLEIETTVHKEQDSTSLNVLKSHISKFGAIPDKTGALRKATPKHQFVVDVIKYQDVIYSSPDSTPCVTPEPSPAPQRKISFKKETTVQANPEKWFFLGSSVQKFKVPPLSGSFKEKNEMTSIQELPFNKRKYKVPNNNNSHKLTVSNFDINAVSPSSW